MSVERNATEIAALKRGIEAVISGVSEAMNKLNDEIRIDLKEIERAIEKDRVRIDRLERYVQVQAEIERERAELEQSDMEEARTAGTTGPGLLKPDLKI
jgi:uncharacterized protein YaaN involved in tellurite resistance